jgi:NTE family protein
MTQCDASADQVVLVLQGGGALGAYQAGVYQALHEHGIEPDWVVGTSIGAINGALIAGNSPATRLDRLLEFWERVSIHGPAFGGLHAVLHGVPNFFQPNIPAFMGLHFPLGINQAAFYTIEPLRKTLSASAGTQTLPPVGS